MTDVTSGRNRSTRAFHASLSPALAASTRSMSESWPSELECSKVGRVAMVEVIMAVLLFVATGPRGRDRCFGHHNP